MGLEPFSRKIKMGKFTNFVLVLLACGLAVTDAVFWPCESDSDCTASKSICSPVTYQCECEDVQTVFSSDFSQCLASAHIGDSCEDTAQCNLMPTGAQCTSAGICDCADGYTYVRGRCRALKNLEESCESDLDCYFGYDRESVACQDNVCSCANGYYHRNGNICRRRSMEIEDACVVNADCEGLGDKVECVSLKCQYVDEKASKSDQNANSQTFSASAPTSSEHGNKNNNDNETDKANNNNNTNVDKLKSESSVTSQLSKTSSKSEESATLSLVNGPSPDADSPAPPHVADSAATIADSTPNTANTPQTASAVPAATPDESRNHKQLREIAVQTSIDAFELRPLAPLLRHVATRTASTSTSTSRRPSQRYRRYRRPSSALFFHQLDDDDKTYSTLSNTDDEVELGTRKFGDYCSENGKPCSGIAHSLCTNSVCLCKQGFYGKNEKCFAELGEIAESDDECEHTFDDLSKKCVCQKNYFYEHSLRSCRKPIQYHLSCTSNSQCSPFGAAFCHPEIPRRCTCEEYAEYDALLQMCQYKQGLGAECETNEGCPVANSMCSNRYCVCQPGFMQQDEKCLPGLGATCENNDECTNVENAECVEEAATSSEEKDKTCQCRKGYVHFKDECVKEAEEIEDECVDNEQCKPLLGTCIDNKCSCTPEQHFKYGRCEDKKGLGSACSRAGECYTDKDPENVECRNSVCQCKFEYQPDNEQKACIRVISNKKNSSGRPSALKIITFILIGSAFLITSAAIKQAYY